MSLEFLQPVYDARFVALSGLIAAFASYVALDLARRVRSEDVYSAVTWGLGGALVMGTGIWSMHFVGMLSMSLPIPIGYDSFTTFLSWIAAVAVSALALYIASRDVLTPTTMLMGALAMGAGICTMHYIGMAALEMLPGIVWNRWLVTASAVIAFAASGAALVIFFLMRRLHGASKRLAQVGAALIMGVAISGMHFTGMAAAGFPVGMICLSVAGLGGHSLETIVIGASLALLSITLVTSMLDSHLQRMRLAHSLTEANEQLKVANTELQRLAFRDPLTGVANRSLFDDRLAHALARIDRGVGRNHHQHQTKLAVLFIDLDGFKPINDSYGHAAGDSVLKQVSNRLRAMSRGADTLARVGGDEFVLLIDDVVNVADAAATAQRVLMAMTPPFDVPGRQLSLSCSIGVVVYPDHGHRDNLMAGADAAMYAAKRSGGSTYVVFESHMDKDVSEEVDLQQDLREALERGQLQLHYQPKIDCRTGRVRGVEALLRWLHPVRGQVSPSLFIPIAERFGLIVPIGNWVIEDACRQIAAWTAEGRRLRVSINLSAYQLRQADIVERVRQALCRHAVAPGQLICEITESVAMDDVSSAQRVIEQFSSLGVQLSIDDFGTGYSSLASLRQLRTHELKIDRSFVRDVANHADARTMVDAIVRLAHALGLRVVAEGVETREQRATLIQLGCDELQGFYFARPMAAAALMKMDLMSTDGREPLDFSASVYMPIGEAA
ncbi:MAG: putative bifunctional diguanylate cyclase/phosphodiesterase [Burkholderiaceae bacterium]